ncbi:hypothetical protein LWI28_021473 [Acer negundo]|uniref:Uncharacterized protein n=1 Tax=Acer negundo TaxID=4023 RepID=A0AAD5J616_ACENE|nr:hypothetical protein LWI28_021473 [Acer negundo]
MRMLQSSFFPVSKRATAVSSICWHMLAYVGMDERSTLSEAHQRALQVEKTITRRGGGGLLSGNDSGTAARTCTSSGSPTSRAAAFSSDVVPRPVAHPKQQPRSPSGLRCFSYSDVKHIQSECKKVVFVEPEDSQEELVENIGVEPIFDEEEEVQEEDVGVGEIL